MGFGGLSRFVRKTSCIQQETEAMLEVDIEPRVFGRFILMFSVHVVPAEVARRLRRPFDWPRDDISEEDDVIVLLPVLPTLRIDILQHVVAANIPLEFGRQCLCRRRAAVYILLMVVCLGFLRCVVLWCGLDSNRDDNAHGIVDAFLDFFEPTV